MAKFSKKVMGKEVGAAEVYAAPHTMTGKTTNVDAYDNYTTGAKVMDTMNMSAGGLAKVTTRAKTHTVLALCVVMALLPRDVRLAERWANELRRVNAGDY